MLLRQIAALLEGPLGDPGEALGRWREVLEAASGDNEAIAALERFMAPATDGGLRLSAAQALEPIYESGRPLRRAGGGGPRLRRRADRRARAPRTADAAGDAGGDALGDKEASRATTALAIRDALSEPELPALLDTYERLAGLERVRRRRDAVPRDQPRRPRRGRQAAPGPPIAEIALRDGDAATAADYHRRVLDRVPEDEDALEALEGIYRAPATTRRSTRSWSGVRSWREDDAKAERELRLQIGALAESPLERLEESIAAFERVLEISANDREAAQALDRLYTKAERWGDCALPRGDAEARPPGRARRRRHPLPAGAD